MALFNKPQISTGTVVSTNESLEDFFNRGVSLHRLTAGKYRARIINATVVKPTTTGAEPYVRVEVELIDDKRLIVDNRFKKGFQIMIDHIKEQLGVQDQDILVSEFIAYLKTIELEVWISYQTVLGKGTYRNINYLPPVTTPSSEAAVTQISDEDY